MWSINAHSHEYQYLRHSLICDWSESLETGDHESTTSTDKRVGDCIILLLNARDGDGFRSLFLKQTECKEAAIGTALLLILKA